MKFSCSQPQLMYGIQHIQKAISNRNTLPVLLGICIKAADQILTLTATDLELAIECRIPAEIQEEGEIVLPGKYFSDIIRNLPGAMIDFGLNPMTLVMKIKSGRSEFNLHGLSAEEFPGIPNFPEDQIFSLPTDILKKSIQQTQFAISHDDSRPVFTGLLVEYKKPYLSMVSTDGYRLAVKESLIEMNYPLLPMIIPGKTMLEIQRILSSRNETSIEIGTSGNQIFFRLPDAMIVSRLIEGQFPQYQQIIPKDQRLTLEIDRNAFLSALERASLITKDGPNIVRLTITKDERLTITATSPEVGDTYDEISIPQQDISFTIAFNVKYLTDVLKVMESEKVLFSLTEPLKPGVIVPDGEEHYKYIVLPVRISG